MHSCSVVSMNWIEASLNQLVFNPTVHTYVYRDLRTTYRIKKQRALGSFGGTRKLWQIVLLKFMSGSFET